MRSCCRIWYRCLGLQSFFNVAIIVHICCISSYRCWHVALVYISLLHECSWDVAITVYRCCIGFISMLHECSWEVSSDPMLHSHILCRGSLPLAVNLYWTMCQTRMVSMRDTWVYTGLSLRGVIPYVQCRAIVFLCREVCSRGYKLVERGCQALVPLVLSVQLVSPCDGCPPLPFIDARVKGKRGIQICATVLRSWEVFSHITVRQEALKGSWAVVLNTITATRSLITSLLLARSQFLERSSG
jgi:hypothetical protein